MIYLFVLFLSLYQADARYGVDLSVSTNMTTWQCLSTEKNISYAKVRVYRSVGAIDENSAFSLSSAYEAGIEDLDVYIFPCVSTSAYSKNNNIVCDSPSTQVLDSITFLEKNGISVLRQTLPESRTTSTPTVFRVWLDIEDEDPPKYFDADPKVNQQLLSEFSKALGDEHVAMGIYTTKTYWTNIMGNVEGYSSYPLWYPRYDGVDSMDFFTPFAGWTDVQIKQTGGDVGYCGITQVDSDYME